MTLTEIAINAAADYRLAVLVSKDVIAAPLRAAIGRRAASGEKRWIFIADLMNCPYCLGVWFAVLIWLVGKWKYGKIFVEILAIAGAQDLIQSVGDNMSSGGRDAA